MFGVYSQDAEGRVRVTHPANCKNNCPACARICPEVAIIFPKLRQEPYDGAVIADEAAARADAKTQRSAVLGSDVYEGLKRRQGSAKRRLLADES